MTPFRWQRFLLNIDLAESPSSIWIPVINFILPESEFLLLNKCFLWNILFHYCLIYVILAHVIVYHSVGVLPYTFTCLWRRFTPAYLEAPSSWFFLAFSSALQRHDAKEKFYSIDLLSWKRRLTVEIPKPFLAAQMHCWYIYFPPTTMNMLHLLT